MGESTVNVGSEHVGHGLQSVFPQRAHMAEEGLLIDGAYCGPVDRVQGVDQIDEGLKVPVCVCVCGWVGGCISKVCV